MTVLELLEVLREFAEDGRGDLRIEVRDCLVEGYKLHRYSGPDGKKHEYLELEVET